MYISDTYNNRIRKVSSDGIIKTIAGNGVGTSNGDGGLAINASINKPEGIAVGKDGSLYIVENSPSRIRRVGTDGIISTLIPSGKLSTSVAITQGEDGNLYLAEWQSHRIRQIDTNGLLTTTAGTGIGGYGGDGGLATSALIFNPEGVAAGYGNTLFIADSNNNRIRSIASNGTLTTLAGGGSESNGTAVARQAAFIYPEALAVGLSGDIYVADSGNHKIRHIHTSLPGYGLNELAIPSQDGSEVYKFDTEGRHTETINTLTNAVIYRFSYDAKGLLQSVADVDGDITSIERDGLGKPTAIVAPDGQRTLLALDGNGYLAQITNPANESHRMVYDANGLLIRYTNPKSNINDYTYDVLGRLTKDTDPVGGGWKLSRTELAQGFTTSLVSGEGRTSQYKVEPLPAGDRRLTSTQPDGTVQTTLYMTNGEQTVTSADGVTGTLLQTPDPRFGMQAPITGSATVKLPSGLTSASTSSRSAPLANANDPFSLISLTDTTVLNGNTYTRTFNKAALTRTQTSPMGRVTTTQLNNKGRPVQTVVPNIDPVGYQYDSRGRLTQVSQGSDPDSRTSQISYNAQGYADTVTDALGRTSRFEYDPAGRITRQTLPDNREISYGYDQNGNLQSITPPGRPPHVYRHTPVDLTQEYTPPTAGLGNSQTLYEYNKDKQLTQITRPDGQVLWFSYNSASGKLAGLALPTGTYNYQYSPTTGKLSKVITPDNNQLAYGYDGSLLTGTTWSGTITGSVNRSYNADFNVTELKVNGADPIAFQYDKDQLLTQAGNLALAYDAQNGLLTGTALDSLTDSYRYNSFGEMIGYQANYATSELYKTAYTRDKLGRIIQKVETAGGNSHTYDYSYDRAGRLVKVIQDGTVSARYGYDDNGNRTTVNGSVVAHYDDQDRLLDYGSATYEYTGNGELKTKTANGTLTRYDYDVLGNLKQVSFANSTVIDYLTDGQNRRIGKKVNGVLTQGWLYQDGLRPIAELDGNNQVVSRFIYASKGNVPDYMIKGGATYRIVSDHLGSPRLVVNIADDTVAQTIDYDVWGKVINDSNPGFQPFGFAGGLYDPDTKLVRFGARDYDAQTGRWTAKDPIRFDGGDSNLFGYVGNDPLNFIDPLGLDPLCAGGGQSIVCTDGQRPPPEGTPLNGPLSPVGAVATAAEAAIAACPPLRGARGATSAIDDLLRAGQQLDRNNLTKAGRALQKHGDRVGSAFPKSSGDTAARNQQGQNVLESILRSENQTTMPNRMGGKDIINNNTGQGARFDANGNMIGFLEP